MRTLRKKWLRYRDAEIVYSLEHKKILEMAEQAGAIYRREGTVLINRDIFADILGTTVEYLICGVIKAPELDADSVELLKLFGAMDEKTKQIMLVQMRAVARF